MGAFSVTWSPDGTHLLYVAWAWDDTGAETEGVVAVPVDQDRPPVVLAIADVWARPGLPARPPPTLATAAG